MKSLENVYVQVPLLCIEPPPPRQHINIRIMEAKVLSPLLMAT